MQGLEDEILLISKCFLKQSVLFNSHTLLCIALSVSNLLPKRNKEGAGEKIQWVECLCNMWLTKVQSLASHTIPRAPTGVNY